MLYLLTFSCYGTHLPGDARGSSDHVRQGTHEFIPPSLGLETYHRRHLRQKPHVLSTPKTRALVREEIVEVCRFRDWQLYALHVRSNHVHGIVEAEAPASRVFGDWKAYATRSLRASGEDSIGRVYWTHGGSARHIRTNDDLTRLIEYVLNGQGAPMETYCKLFPLTGVYIQ